MKENRKKSKCVQFYFCAFLPSSQQTFTQLRSKSTQVISNNFSDFDSTTKNQLTEETKAVEDALEPQPAELGCPVNQYKCHNHCQENGSRGGYCEFVFKCTCY